MQAEETNGKVGMLAGWLVQVGMKPDQPAKLQLQAVFSAAIVLVYLLHWLVASCGSGRSIPTSATAVTAATATATMVLKESHAREKRR